MGELFRQIHPEKPSSWTGERMVPGQTGAIEAEHYHRYLLARELCRGKDVLDVASGEGYGSALLAQAARSVVGVELDPVSVEHASREYRGSNLRYAVGDAAKLPLAEHSVDVVVSFETIEHISDQASFLSEVKRVLRPGGFLFVSAPDINVYLAGGAAPNPFHVRELTDTEFREALSASFHHVAIARQRAFSGCAIVPETVEGLNTTAIFERRDRDTFGAYQQLLRAPFLLAVASDQELPALGVSLYVQANCNAATLEVMSELERLRGVESKFREQQPVTAKALSDAAIVPALQAELDRLRKVEDTAREQLATIARLSAGGASARAEAEGYRRASDALQADFAQAQRDFATDRNNLQVELGNTRDELAALRDVQQDLNRYKVAYQEAIGLLIPWRVRRALPEAFKPPLRAIKRAVRSFTRRKP